MSSQEAAKPRGSIGRALTITVNGRERTAAGPVPPWRSLLTALREDFGLPGAKNACEQGECGSCTVCLDGEPVCSCLVAAWQAEGREVRTVEGLGDADGALGAVQQAFVECGAVQCGFCTPGLIVAVDALVHSSPGRPPGAAEVREALAGNLCRCTGYEKIIEAVGRAAELVADQDTQHVATEGMSR
ncbi:MAG TPA: (2Fe-2S)-binding protein [Actinocrinis sp.]|jgi:carbon-monoxide dehydrogenase small subunit